MPSHLAAEAEHQGWEGCLRDGAAGNKKQGKDNNGRCVHYDPQALLQQQPRGSTAGAGLSLEIVLADYCLDQF